MTDQTIIVVQARMSSSRLPQKMMKPISGVCLYEYVLRRCKESKISERVVLATSNEKSDRELVSAAQDRGFDVYCGSLEDVQKRTIDCALQYGASIVIRVCGDSPFVDLEAMEVCHQILVKEDLEYCAVNQETCIPGLDSEVIRLSALKKARELDSTIESIEHVTYFIRRNPHLFQSKLVSFDLRPLRLADLKLTVDNVQDYELCCRIASNLQKKGKSYQFCSSDIIDELSLEINLEKTDHVV